MTGSAPANRYISNIAILLGVGSLLQRGDAMRPGVLVFFLCVPFTAVCQSAAPVPLASSAENQQITRGWTACNQLFPRASVPCFALKPNAPKSRATQDLLWSKMQPGANDSSPTVFSKDRMPQSGALIAQNGPWGINPPLSLLWPGVKVEPIPTQWPNARFEKIPTQWSHVAMKPVEAQPAADGLPIAPR